MRLTQTMAVVQALSPIDINGGAVTSDIISTKLYNHIVFLVSVGNLAGDCAMTVEECDDNAPTTNTAIGFSYRVAAALGGAFGALTTVGVGGYTILNASDDNKVFAIEVDAEDLTDGYPLVRVCLANPAAAGLFSVVALGMQPRYQADAMPLPTS